MTRKRFVKLMMAQGYSRNGVERLIRALSKGNRFNNYFEIFCVDNCQGAVALVFPEGLPVKGRTYRGFTISVPENKVSKVVRLMPLLDIYLEDRQPVKGQRIRI